MGQVEVIDLELVGLGCGNRLVDGERWNPQLMAAKEIEFVGCSICSF